MKGIQITRCWNQWHKLLLISFHRVFMVISLNDQFKESI